MTRAVTWGFAAALIAAATSALPAFAQEEHRERDRITPYIEAGQVLTADLSGNGDMVTYSTVSVGVDASVHSRRVEVEGSYRYTHAFAEHGNLENSDEHSGLVSIRAKVAPGFTVEAGGIATRSRVDPRGAVVGNTTADAANVSQVYSGYIGPNFAGHAGPLNLNAAYRFGYTHADAPSGSGFSGSGPALDSFGTSKDQVASASVSLKSGLVLPIGVTVSGGWEHEDADQLDSRYDDKAVRGDVVLPVGGGLAFEAGAGYEKVRATQRDPKVDATGQPVLNSSGRYVTDPNSPERVAFESDGLIWDAGVVYKPSRRATLEARVGKRYGSMSYTGSVQMQLGRVSSLQVGVYDSVTSFGRQLNGAIAMLPTSFAAPVDPFGDQFNNCVFNTSGTGVAGGCLNSAFQSMPSANYRARGVDAVYTVNMGRTTLGLGAGYSNRLYYGTQQVGVVYSLAGVTDQSIYAQMFVNRALSRQSGVTANVFGSYFDSGVAGAHPVYGGGANATYYHNWGRLGFNLSAGLFGYGAQTGGSDVQAQATAGIRYQF